MNKRTLYGLSFPTVGRGNGYSSQPLPLWIPESEGTLGMRLFGAFCRFSLDVSYITDGKRESASGWVCEAVVSPTFWIVSQRLKVSSSFLTSISQFAKSNVGSLTNLLMGFVPWPFEEGMVLPSICRWVPGNLTLFQTKETQFCCLVPDKIMKIDTLFQTEKHETQLTFESETCPFSKEGCKSRYGMSADRISVSAVQYPFLVASWLMLQVIAVQWAKQKFIFLMQ